MATIQITRIRANGIATLMAVIEKPVNAVNSPPTTVGVHRPIDDLGSFVGNAHSYCVSFSAR